MRIFDMKMRILRLDQADGELLGICEVPVTGDWQKWQSFTARIKQTEGKKNLCLVFKPHKAGQTGTGQAGTGQAETNNTVIFAQFPGLKPNEAQVEINVRPTVITPEKTNIDYLTVRGFDLRNAAPNWAAPTAGQRGLITAYWCKGWIIENNQIHHSRCLVATRPRLGSRRRTGRLFRAVGLKRGSNPSLAAAV
jgi:alpha-L-arabinofuranosidase